ncbi:uncharacterized protein Z519_05352 [Cladophialophora bantiana CBS 173.52]|uniref:PLD phosphodiesterase domain-containing protein n=1 Tax=Cladophialophora bantiana (strain ATCC 10958 / CBS 173.52 / CDC B-1940 / NIH 8579) TaxID=1442370 RepID=A0A0D2EW54_CLAB1|nr:uncharacterized protein Z519_05352 [Cladophialophora bantiana CBS 173.52]KIW94036.1 hypothetical protein Z519_05352 [Cladophialophora bantiana CBS 173.52]
MEGEEPLVQQAQQQWQYMTASAGFSAAYIDEISQGRRTLSSSAPSPPHHLHRPLTTGTGASIYESAIIPAIRAAQDEVVLATCFWAAASTTRTQICEALKYLSRRVLAASSSSSSSSSSPRKVSVQICFSSCSLARNMLLPTPQDGQIYQPASWGKLLGLPQPDEVKGLELRVVRKFFWPWGIVHSKYVIVDGALAIFPSCNVSWECWFEVAISLTGPVVDHLRRFHANFWEKGTPPLLPECPGPHLPPTATDDPISSIPTTLLLSPHTPTALPNHLQPRVLLGRFPCMPSAPLTFPPTPLLKATHHLLSTARSCIVILTPNLTEPAVLECLAEALGRGVRVCIWTNCSLMTAEQLVTAGTTTPRCIRKLRRRALLAGTSALLETFYFDADDGPSARLQQRRVLRENEHDEEENEIEQDEGEDQESIPVKLHAKVTIVDDERILLGSGNMDAASWKTSQELGVLVESRAVVDEFKRLWKYSKL